MTEENPLQPIQENAQKIVAAIESMQEQYKSNAGGMIESLKLFQDQANTIVEGMRPMQEAVKAAVESITPQHSHLVESLKVLTDLQSKAAEEAQKINDVKAQVDSFYENEFTPIKEIIDDPENGLEKAYQSAQDSLNNIQELQTQIEEKKKEIEEIATTGNNINSENLQLKESLEKTLGVATDKSLSNGFCEIKESLQFRSIGWLMGFFTFFGVAIGRTAFSIYHYDEISANFNQNTQTSGSGNIVTYNSITDKTEMEWEMIRFWLIRLSIVFPLLFVAYLCFKEYSILRKRIEHYEFKIATAGSMQSYIDILKSRFLGDLGHEAEMDLKNHILQFIIQSMGGIYKEPLPESVAQLELKAKIKEYEVELKVGGKNKKRESKEEE